MPRGVAGMKFSSYFALVVLECQLGDGFRNDAVRIILG